MSSRPLIDNTDLLWGQDLPFRLGLEYRGAGSESLHGLLYVLQLRYAIERGLGGLHRLHRVEVIAVHVGPRVLYLLELLDGLEAVLQEQMRISAGTFLGILLVDGRLGFLWEQSAP